MHARTRTVAEARLELQRWVLDWVQRHGLTFGETIGILGGEVEDWAKIMVRQERHPNDPTKPADLA